MQRTRLIVLLVIATGIVVFLKRLTKQPGSTGSWAPVKQDRGVGLVD